MKRGIPKGTKMNLKDKEYKCVKCGRSIITTGHPKYCWECKDI